jgi:hypothetical protein
MNVQPSDSRQYQPASQQGAATGGAFLDVNFLVGHDIDKSVLAVDYNQGKDVYEPTPLAAGPAHNACSAGVMTLAFNIILHLITLIVTIIAAAAHFQEDGATKHLTPTHKEDYVSSWCIVMIAGEVIGVIFYVLWFGLVRRSFSNPLPAILGGGCFLAVFVCTIKLSYYLSIGTMFVDPADGLQKNTNGIMHTAHDGSGWAQAALYLQCFVIASIFFTPSSGTYFKLAQLETSIVPMLRSTRASA